ncbi:MAG: hypothetical protein OSA47_08695 [Novosphingopyxis baekryungensis]|jgi:hypothetical protein|nr:hypothetical protein [Novosphingopyxis baekryungensis]
MSLLLALLLQSAAPVASIAPMQQRDIDCVASFGLIAFQQAQDAPGADRLPAMAAPGKTYAGLVGTRLLEETGLPRDVIASAIAESARAQSAQAGLEDPMAFLGQRYAQCAPLMAAEIAAGGDLPLPVPQGR